MWRHGATVRGKDQALEQCRAFRANLALLGTVRFGGQRRLDQYCTAKGTAFFAALNGGAGWVEAVQVAWSGADQALWSGVLNFWFVGRVWDRAKS